MSISRIIYVCIAILLVVLCLRQDIHSEAVEPAADETMSAPRPVEEDMHEFMEYVFEPSYKRLKASMASKPEDKKAWKPVKSNALVLAEGGNLLLARVPEKNADSWRRLAVEVRDLGGQLYRAGKEKDYEAATASYKAMLLKCNSCHQQFAEGKYQLKP